jgi:hypothetical protein
MGTCEHCVGRGWGIREGYVRRCEVCCQLRDDMAARQVAQGALASFALRERPSPHLPPDGAMRCPWCGHLPSNVDIDTFWMFAEGTAVCRARVGRLDRHPEDEEQDDGLWLLEGEQSFDDEPIGDIRLWCPNPSCGKTFSPPDVDFESDPEAT